MKKRALIAIAALMMAASPALAKHKIYVSMARSDDTFVGILKDSIIAAAKANPDVDLTVETANNNADTQMSQVRKAIADKADVVVVLSVNGDSAKTAMAETAKAGVPLIFFNRLPPIERFEGKVAIVASNDLVAGRLQMRLLSRQIGDSGNVVILRGEEGHPAARDRTIGVKEILATKPGIKVVAEATGNWKREQAEELIGQWLDEGKVINAIAANNDEMALGAIDALQARGYKPGQIAIGGVDGTTFALDAVKSGWLTMSVLQNAEAQAQQTLVDAVKFANKEYAQLYDWVPYQVIIPSNVDTFMAK
ncbi:putative rhizopine-binding protein [Asticcacaulis biprosthecium C19]|uniref:Putative rhizopine-binding protein n=1 Tax=Asticcacaulis biprosthecium C19 TaxID=715226 RepID=F4QJS5_9CAUL|nr:substrate-binding domain-containing protein [Asticcacaulis biprosthecium]EGF93182.1 putative rhizopine-binding protein [Asticcacaulis biprosthecium C19]